MVFATNDKIQALKQKWEFQKTSTYCLDIGSFPKFYEYEMGLRPKTFKP